jgi:hypothetical protein
MSGERGSKELGVQTDEPQSKMTLVNQLEKLVLDLNRKAMELL